MQDLYNKETSLFSACFLSYCVNLYQGQVRWSRVFLITEVPQQLPYQYLDELVGSVESLLGLGDTGGEERVVSCR